MKKYIFSDLDGTLIQAGNIKEQDIVKIQNWVAQGNEFCVATGRPYVGLKHLAGVTNFKYAICCNGALITDAKGKIIFSKYVADADVQKVLNMIGDDFYVVVTDGFKHQQIFANEIVQIDQVLAFSISPKDGDGSKSQAKLDELKALELDISLVLNGTHLDVGPANVSKGNAINIVAEKLKIAEKNIYVVGDQLNDVSMFEMYDNSFCISIGNEEAKTYANNIIDFVGDIIDSQEEAAVKIM